MQKSFKVSKKATGTTLVDVVVQLWTRSVDLSNAFTFQTQPSRGVLRQRCSENMQQFYKRTPMPKCDFNKIALQLYWNRTSSYVFCCKFAACFQDTFSEEHFWMAASNFCRKLQQKFSSFILFLNCIYHINPLLRNVVKWSDTL